MTDVLPTLLARIRDGIATDADRVRARALVEVDSSLPEDVRTVALTVPDEASEDAVALLALLDLDSLDLEGSESSFAVESDVADDVMAALGLDPALPIADAVAFEAGTLDVAGRVMAELGATRSVPVAVPAPLPVAANNARGFRFAAVASASTFRWGAVAVAAAALLALILGRGELTGGGESEHLVFAQAGDVVVEDLSYAEGVQVAQLEGADGAVILWVDDGDV
jgi:hypothetical protein